MKLDLNPSEYSRLYDEADHQSDDILRIEEELNPLFHALDRVEQRYGGEELIGKGGMKEVLRVYDARTERHVALARPRGGIREERFDSFLREAHITARLEHPNIIKLFDMGIDSQRRPFFTMEFKRGKSLRKIISELKKGKDEYPYEVRISAFLRICEAMAYAHSRRVLHLDLKPENIQVGTFGEVQVCDWGMGEIERGESEDVASVALLDPDLYGDQLEPAVKGTPGYMAPEQRDSKAVKNGRTDIFALGCLLYEITSLRPPTDRDRVPVPSPAVEAIVRKACAEHPGDRYENVESLREDVNRHLLGFSATVEKAGFFREVRLFYRRNRLPCQLSLLFTVLLLGSGTWFTLQLREGFQRTTVALGQVKEALGRAEESEGVAKVQRLVAEGERDRAEEALAKYEREREYASVLLKRSAEDIGESNLLLDFLIMNEAISLTAVENAMKGMDQILADNPPPSNQLWAQKAYTLFLTQRFSEAEEFYAIRQGTQKDLRDLIPDFSNKVDERGLLPVDDFIRLIRRMAQSHTDRAPLMEKMLIYDCLKRDSLSDKARMVRAMIRLSNPSWSAPVFKFSPADGHLLVGGDGLVTLYRSHVPQEGAEFPSRCLLRLLKLNSLVVRSSSIKDLKQLDGLNLKRLDIRTTNVTDIESLVSMESLNEFVIEPGQFDEEELAVLPETVKVIELALPQE